MVTTVGWGVIGTGPMAEAFVRGLAALPEASVVAVASRSAARAREFADRMMITEAFGSAEELVSSPAVDLVYVATTNDVHREHMLAALGAGKPVVCEKPFAQTGQEAREVADLARSRGLLCMEAMWTRFLPGMTRLRELVDEGSIGEVHMLSADIGYPYVVEPGGRLWRPELGGGVLLDLGVYLVSMAVDLLGPVEKVAAVAHVGQTGVEDRLGLVLQHSGGRIASLSATLTGASSNEAVLSGSRGSIRIAAPFYRTERLEIRSVAPAVPGAGGGRSGRLSLLTARPEVRHAVRLGQLVVGRIRRTLRVVVAGYEGNGYHYQAAEAMRCLEAGLTQSPRMTLDDSIAVLDVIDEVRRQLAVGPAAS